MGVAGGPKIKRDDLVFGFDTYFNGVPYVRAYENLESRYYKGQPTINFGPKHFGDWGTEGTAYREATGRYYKGQPTYYCRGVVGEAWRGVDTTIPSLRGLAGTSGTVTMSCWVRNNNVSSYYVSSYIGHDFSSNRNVLPGGNWQHIEWTVNASSMVNDYVEFRPNTGELYTYLEMTMPQVEVNKGYATSYTDGQRYDTNTLIDISGNETSIDVNRLNFSSDGDLISNWNGSSNYIILSWSTKWAIGSNATIVMVLKPSNSKGNDRLWCVNNNTSGLDAYLNGTSYNVYMHGGVVGTTTSLVVNQWNHLVVTYTNGTIQMYVNGTQGTMTGQVNGYNITNTEPLYIAAYRNGAYNFQGEISVFKMHGNPMSENEVKQDYNTYKKRFNI